MRKATTGAHGTRCPFNKDTGATVIRTIYAVHDKVAQDISGTLMLFAHDAVAVRIFTDAFRDQGSMIANHPADFELLALGTLEGTEITPQLRVVLDGQTLAATQEGK